MLARAAAAATVSLASRTAARLSAAEECSLKPKDKFLECKQCPEMVVVPAGAFTMGSPEGEKGREGPGSYQEEGPQHTVTISKPFAVGRLHVTVDQFAAFVRATGYEAGSKCHISGKGDIGSWRNPGFGQEGSHPVVCLKPNVIRLSATVGGLRFRLKLPSEIH